MPRSKAILSSGQTAWAAFNSGTNHRFFPNVTVKEMTGDIAKAIRYTLGHWCGLTMFLSDGRVEVDSNTVERTMRTIAQGRHSYLFAGSERGARNWAILASLLTTARLNGVDPLTWLTDVLERIVSGRTKNHQLHELLPWEWKATRAAQDMKAAA